MDRLFGKGIPDHDKRTQCGDFPEEVDPCDTVGKNDAVHCKEKKEDGGKEFPAAVRDFRVLLVIMLHVADGVYRNEGAHNPDDQGHDKRKIVNEQTNLSLGHPARQVIPDHGPILDNDEKGNPVQLQRQTPAYVQEDERKGDITCNNEPVEKVRSDLKVLSLALSVRNGQADRSGADENRRDKHDPFLDRSRLEYQKQDSRQERK